MTKGVPPPSVVRFRQRLTALRQAPGAKVARLTFPHAVNAGGLHHILRACFDELATDYGLPHASVVVNGAAHWLTPAGYGLWHIREATGAVQGDAYTDSFTLLVAGDVLISTDITEDSYQPELTLLLTAATDEALDRLVPVLERLMHNAAG